MLIDLTHPLDADIPAFGGARSFELRITGDYQDCTPPNLFRTQSIEMLGGAGTHMDAPAHCIPGGKTIDALDENDLFADCVVIRVDNVAKEDYVIPPEVVHAFEKTNGSIPKKAFVIFYTGWEQYWNDAKKYRNDLKFPSVHEDTAKLLLERDITGIGMDTLSSDARGEDFPVHRIMLGAGKILVENVANAKDLPPTGAKILIMPMKIKDGTEAPVRLVAMI